MTTPMEWEFIAVIDEIIPEDERDPIMVGQFARRLGRIARKYGANEDVLSQ